MTTSALEGKTLSLNKVGRAKKPSEKKTALSGVTVHTAHKQRTPKQAGAVQHGHPGAIAKYDPTPALVSTWLDMLNNQDMQIRRAGRGRIEAVFGGEHQARAYLTQQSA